MENQTSSKKLSGRGGFLDVQVPGLKSATKTADGFAAASQF
jgi:hypothetical protein